MASDPTPKQKSPQKDDEVEKKEEEQKDEKPAEDQKEDAKDGDKKDSKADAKAAKDEVKKEDKPADEQKDEKPKAKDTAKARPGEPEFKLKTDVEKLIFKSDKLTEEPVIVNFSLHNTSGKRQTFKVKCTSNSMFTIRPPLGFIEKDGNASVKIAFASKDVPAQNIHYVVIYHMEAEEKTDKKPRALWNASNAAAEGVKRLMCSFEKADGTPYTSEKK